MSSRSARLAMICASGLAATAGGVAVYLWWIATQQRGLPLGCGPEAGCAEVLTSRWASLAGLPVSGLAVPLYLSVAVVALLPTNRATMFVLRFAAVTLWLSAIWFISLQVLVLKAYCAWCVLEHGLGVIVGVLVWHLASHASSKSDRVLSIGLAVASVVGLAVLQSTLAPPVTTVRLGSDARAPAGAAAADAPVLGSVSDQAISLLQGQLSVDPADEPLLGHATAIKQLFVMYDYCCPHCRQTHAYLLEALSRHPDELAVICLPTPRDADCNPAIGETEERFANACELAELAISVWTVDSRAFAAFDRWLFASRRPRQPADALTEAERLVDPRRLAAARVSPAAAQRIRRNVTAFNASSATYLPVLLVAGKAPIVGRPESDEALQLILQEDLGLGLARKELTDSSHREELSP